MLNASNINRILIVGGGTAGWMAATYLSRFLAHTDCRITLVESADIGTVGVGEATIPTMVSFVRNLRIDEHEFMRRCNATYKLGIRFIDWVHNDHAYWHTFGRCGGLIDGLDLFHFWLKAARAGRESGPYSTYSLHALLAERYKAPRPFRDTSPIIEHGTYAYHLDAAALATLLKETATASGVTHHYDDVSNVRLDDRGWIEHIDTASGRSLSADLYVDCTGFDALLIERALGDPWVDWSDTLLCDRAAVMPMPREDTIPPFPPYTRSIGLSAGWMWKIPLSHRVGCGYVYSTAHTDDEQAAREMIQAAGVKKRRSVDLRHINMRVGRRRNFWLNNCVSVGLASGFVEPLESTGIYFIQHAMELLMAYFPDQQFNPRLTAEFNHAMSVTYDEVRDFILLHYLMSKRDDHPFWTDSRHVPITDAFNEMIELYKESGQIGPGRNTVFADTSYYHIFSGGDCLPRRHSPRADSSDFQDVCKILDKIKARNAALEQAMPTHEELMRVVHPKPVGPLDHTARG